MYLEMVVAADANNGIGKDNKLPWPHNKLDMSWFYSNTKNKIVVMGRKTWESLPSKPLKERVNVVVTSDDSVDADILVRPGPNGGLHETISSLGQYGKQIILIGGAQFYREMLPHVNKIYLTRFKQSYDCDTFLPELSAIQTGVQAGQWTTLYKDSHPDMTFYILGRNFANNY